MGIAPNVVVPVNVRSVAVVGSARSAMEAVLLERHGWHARGVMGLARNIPSIGAGVRSQTVRTMKKRNERNN